MIPAEFIEPRRLFVRSQRAPGRTAVFHGPVPTAGRAGTRQRRRRRPGDYIFERDATMPGAARGFADVFYRDHFAWGRGGSKYPAWESILNETTQLELLPSQMKQAEPQKAAADGAVTARLP